MAEESPKLFVCTPKKNGFSKPSKNAIVAKSGIYADTHEVLTQYFGKIIVKCEKVKGRTKSDVAFAFSDGSKAMAQVKNGTGGGSQRSKPIAEMIKASANYVKKTRCPHIFAFVLDGEYISSFTTTTGQVSQLHWQVVRVDPALLGQFYIGQTRDFYSFVSGLA